MGCGCSNNKAINYEYKGVKRSIPGKQAHTLDRWSMGAIARFKVKLIKKGHMKSITNLGRPCFANGKYTEDVRKPMMANQDLDKWYREHGS